MSDKNQELVLGIPTERLRQAGLFQGFKPFDPKFFAFLLDPSHVEYRLRGPAEQDPEFKQLIPYIVLKHGDRVFNYRRGASGAEVRLRALRSVGIGGHISKAEDAAAADPYRAGMLRELQEEVDLRTTFGEQMFGLINDDATPVGTVHLGVVHLLELDRPSVRAREDCLAEFTISPLEALRSQLSDFETWSRFVLEELGRESS